MIYIIFNKIKSRMTLIPKISIKYVMINIISSNAVVSNISSQLVLGIYWRMHIIIIVASHTRGVYVPGIQYILLYSTVIVML